MKVLQQFWLPLFEKYLNYKSNHRGNERFEERMDLLSTLLALYPTTSNEELSKEFLLTPHFINMIAAFHGVYKSKETRGAINRNNMMSSEKSRNYFFAHFKKKKEEKESNNQ